MTPEDFQELNQKYPYLSYIRFLNEDIVGIIQNLDNQILSMFVYNRLTTNNEKIAFLEYGRIWWEDSNQQIPISIFIKEDFAQFQKILHCFPKKDIKEIYGPTVSLEQNFAKRIKRKKIQLIRMLDH